MSGFRKHETRFVKSEYIWLGPDHDKCVQSFMRILIPHYDRYLLEFKSSQGDDSRCARTFLGHVLPFVVETLLQCGCWMIHEFPLHPITFWLCKLPGYYAPSKLAIAEVELFTKTRMDNRMNEFSADTAHAVGNLQN
jgi:hypothetical protein